MMNVTRWNPFEELNSLHHELDRVFGYTGGEGRTPVGESSWVPATEIATVPDGWQVRMALPGIDPGDVKIDLNGDTLTVAGERANRREDAELNRSEINYGRFERMLTLPSNVDTDRVEANFDNGMLDLSLPLAESAKPRRIEIGGRSANA
ncbi:MAG: HSP20 family small heat-shock protein [Acidobacteria bacterium]|nr:HSP20 family small heat-shock protein [Acidobacteriota bacterium]